MLNDSYEWQHRAPEFLVEAQMLLARSEECLSHLQLISNDRDAIDCMLGTLLNLANKADALALQAVSGFSRRIHDLLSQAQSLESLNVQALEALKNCLTLMAWQLELFDVKTGQLGLDDSEQITLIEAFAAQLVQQPLRLLPLQARTGTGSHSNDRL